MIVDKIFILSWISSQCCSTKLKNTHNWFSFSISVADIPHGSRPFQFLSHQQQMCRCGSHVLYSHNKYPPYTRFKLESGSTFSWVLYLNNFHAMHKRSRLHLLRLLVRVYRDVERKIVPPSSRDKAEYSSAFDDTSYNRDLSTGGFLKQKRERERLNCHLHGKAVHTTQIKCRYKPS